MSTQFSFTYDIYRITLKEDVVSRETNGDELCRTHATITSANYIQKLTLWEDGELISLREVVKDNDEMAAKFKEVKDRLVAIMRHVFLTGKPLLRIVEEFHGMSSVKLEELKLNEIADLFFDDISGDKNQDKYYAVLPYARAMCQVETLEDDYIFEKGKDVVMYFLSNATIWRGETAKAVKTELKRRLQASR
jgi:hypothetical protein